MKQLHNRRSIRLKGYDYAQTGAYFVTICTKNRECLFGEIADGDVVLNEWGEIVKNEWLRTLKIRPNVIVDEYIVMPNHLHGILIIVDDGRGGRGVSQYAPTTITPPYAPTMQCDPTTNNQNTFKSPSKTIGAIIRGFKSATTKQINISRNTPGQPVWQRNYYEHIIRDDESLHRIRQYITQNPIRWQNDRENAGSQLVILKEKENNILNENYNIEAKTGYVKG